MSRSLYWLSDEAWLGIELHLPKNQPRARRGFWAKLLVALAETGAVTKSTAIDSTYIKAQRAGDRPLSRRVDNQDHALTDMLCRPYALILTVGNVSDVKAAPALLGRADHTCGDIRC
ncbi:hypothetical protein [Novosphingobium sp.]|uniref:hypothetical protein n=1 Tax=Novosphingobium sp. TaxID=1874826 RepID=UPI00352A8ADC